MGHRRSKGDAIAQAPHEACVQPLVPPERADAPHSILRRVGSTLGALAVQLLLLSAVLGRLFWSAFGKAYPSRDYREKN